MRPYSGTVTFLTWILLLVVSAAVPGFAAPTPDRSWTVDDYIRVGMPDPSRLWTAADYRQCHAVLLAIDRTNRAALPRMASSASGPVFQRIVNATNTQFLTQGVLPSHQRKELLIFLVNSLPSFLDLYKLSMIDPAFHREAIELHGVHLRVLRIAVELDGQSFPPDPGESKPTRFNLVELHPSLRERMEPGGTLSSDVPRGDRFAIVGAYCAADVSRLLPWIGDGAQLPEEERLMGARYLRDPLPHLWRHILPATQQELRELLDGTLANTRPPSVRAELEAVRSLLKAP